MIAEEGEEELYSGMLYCPSISGRGRQWNAQPVSGRIEVRCRGKEKRGEEGAELESQDESRAEYISSDTAQHSTVQCSPGLRGYHPPRLLCQCSEPLRVCLRC